MIIIYSTLSLASALIGAAVILRRRRAERQKDIIEWRLEWDRKN